MLPEPDVTNSTTAKTEWQTIKRTSEILTVFLLLVWLHSDSGQRLICPSCANGDTEERVLGQRKGVREGTGDCWSETQDSG